MISLSAVPVPQIQKPPENRCISGTEPPQNRVFPEHEATVQSIFAMETADNSTRGRRYAGWLKVGERRYGLRCVGFTDSDVCPLPAPRPPNRKGRKNAVKEAAHD